jgi:CBS domain-containing protein
VVTEGGSPCGIVTDRAIILRAVATERDPKAVTLRDICSKTIAAVRPEQPLDDAIALMKSHDVKRVLVMSDRGLAGIVSLGDLTARGVAEDVQEDLSRAEPNN